MSPDVLTDNPVINCSDEDYAPYCIPNEICTHLECANGQIQYGLPSPVNDDPNPYRHFTRSGLLDYLRAMIKAIPKGCGDQDYVLDYLRKLIEIIESER